jgi:hypothetical protein
MSAPDMEKQAGVHITQQNAQVSENFESAKANLGLTPF